MKSMARIKNNKPLSKYETILKKGIPYHDYSEKTAWLIGAGNTLLEVWDWQVPDNVITFTLNSSIMWAWEHWLDDRPDKVIMKGKELHEPEDYRRRADFWFARDTVIFTPSYIPEKWYSQIAMRHPTMTKIVAHHCKCDYDMPNLHLMICETDWQRVVKLDIPYMHKLMAGPTTLLTVLHYIYRCKFKKVVLSGVDFCRYLTAQPRPYREARRWMDMRGIQKNHEMNEGDCRKENAIKDTSGETVYQCGMMRNHMNAGMGMIRKMQAEGITFFKTSPRGMVHVPYIKNDKTLAAIANGVELKYNRVTGD